MRTLHLPLKGKWYRMIKSGEKPEEYREINSYWIKRLIDERIYDSVNGWRRYELGPKSVIMYAEHIDQLKYDLINGYAAFKDFSVAHFTLGYPKADDTDKNMFRWIEGLGISNGNPNWGAEEGKDYFVIRLK